MSTAKKILVVAAVCVLAAAGGVFAAVAPGFARGALESESASAVRSAPGLASPVVAPVKVDITPADAAKQVNPATPGFSQGGQWQDRKRHPHQHHR